MTAPPLHYKPLLCEIMRAFFFVHYLIVLISSKIKLLALSQRLLIAPVYPVVPSPELFDNYMQQDAHEFLNYLLNTIADLLLEEKSQERQQNGKLASNGAEAEEPEKTQQTWVHEIFQGTLTNETRCLNCEAVRWTGDGSQTLSSVSS